MSDKSETRAEHKAAAEHKAHLKHKGQGEHATLPFVRAGGMLVNLEHVVFVGLPVEGDPKAPLSLTLVNGHTLTLTGDDAEAVLGCLGDCCDVTAEKAEKAEK